MKAVLGFSGFEHRMAAENGRVSWSLRTGLWLSLDWQECRGVGDASPLPGMSVESLVDIEEFLRPFQGKAVDVTELLGEAPPSVDIALRAALLSMHHQCASESISALAWGRVAASPPCSSIELARWVTTEGEDAAAEIAGFAQQGGKIVKRKLRPDHVEDEFAAARKWHAAFPQLSFRFDANGVVTAAELRDAARMLQDIPVDFVEEVADEGHCPFRRAFDESLARDSLEHCLERLDTEPDAVVVLKPTLLGFDKCQGLAAKARRVVYSHLLEQMPAFSFVCELALRRGIGEVHGLYPPAHLAQAYPVFSQCAAQLTAAQLHEANDAFSV